MKILVLNSGSSSIKFQLFEMKSHVSLASGLIEQIGSKHSLGKIKYQNADDIILVIKKEIYIHKHEEGLNLIIDLLKESKVLFDLNDLYAIGHRVVHGGERFLEPIKISEEVICEIEQLIPLAPLHNPANLDGIRVTKKLCPNVPQIAVFDTAFHSTLPQYAYMYALPYDLYERDGVRKYGFHGTSHHFVVKEASKYLKKDIKSLNAITLHLGNGASMAAIKNGLCIDTSMGLTPLEGLIMGTRSGDLDPAILFYLARKNHLNIDELDTLLNKKSGLKGICGNNDMREIEELAHNDNKNATLALEMFAYRIKKYIGAYSAVLGSVDCVIFTGGIGENDIKTRQRCCENLENLGIKLDMNKNNSRSSKILEIDCDDSKVDILVIPTNEELEIAIQTHNILTN